MNDTLVTIIVAMVSGGAVGEVLRYVRERRSSQPGGTASRASTLAEFESLRHAYRSEISRLTSQVRDLERVVLALSSEVIRLGGDPFTVRAALLEAHIPHDEEEQEP